MKKAKTLVTLIGTLLAGRTALKRIRAAKQDDDRLELVDAALNIAVVITGTLVIVRRLSRGEEA